MKKHTKYKEHFNKYNISKLFREAYSSYVDSCQNYRVLLQLGDGGKAIKLYFASQQKTILEEIKTNLNIDSSKLSIKK